MKIKLNSLESSVKKARLPPLVSFESFTAAAAIALVAVDLLVDDWTLKRDGEKEKCREKHEKSFKLTDEVDLDQNN